MKKILMVFCAFFFFFSLAHAGGGTTHMFIAEETIAKLPDKKLRDLILDNLDAYLVGAYYPDSGYVQGAHYGEDSHWDPFIYAFADYIKEKYSNPTIQHPKLVAFLLGCATHRVSDEVIHWTFYNIMKDKEFSGDYNQAHSHGDNGIDLLLILDKNRWTSLPSTWWVPVNDLVNIYHRMGKDEYTASEITWGNTAIYLAGYAERIIAAPAYPILKLKMPWTAAHYYDWPEGGILMDEQKVADYLMNLWGYLNNKSQQTSLIATKHRLSKSHAEPSTVDFAQEAIKSGVATVPVKSNEDGSIELQSPIINQFIKFNTLIDEFFRKLIS